MKVQIELDENTAKHLERTGIILGFKRITPGKRWGADEVRGAIRYAIEKLIEKEVGS